jgi:hypothetical protein
LTVFNTIFDNKESLEEEAIIKTLLAECTLAVQEWKPRYFEIPRASRGDVCEGNGRERLAADRSGMQTWALARGDWLREVHDAPTIYF